MTCQAPFFCAQVGRAEAFGITRCPTSAAALLVHDAIEIIVRRADGSPFPYAERRREPVEQVAAVCWAHLVPRLLGKREAATLRARGEIEAAPHVSMLLLGGAK